jgi:hypothetical protein
MIRRWEDAGTDAAQRRSGVAAWGLIPASKG